MENNISIFIARTISLIYFSVSFAMLTGQLKRRDIVDSFEKSKGLTLLLGIFGLFIGSLIINYHNIWIKGWPVLITILGWFAIIESMLLIAMPKIILSLGSKMSDNEKIWGFVALAISIIFGYFGFVV